MGNAVPRIHHRHEATAPSSGATTTALLPSGRRHGRKAARDAPVRRPRVAAEDEQKTGGGTTVAMTPVPSGRRHGGKAAGNATVRRPRVAADDDRKAGGGTNPVVTVKVVVTRKEAERLIARLEEHNAKERKARIADITRRLRAGGDGGAGSPSPASCGGARTSTRLAPIQEV